MFDKILMAKKLSIIGVGNLVLPVPTNSFDSHHRLNARPHSLEGEFIKWVHKAKNV